MSKKLARCSLYVLGMACLTVRAAEPLTSLDKPEGRLDIIARPGYIERGQTDKQYDWVSQFEKETGCQVNVKTAATSDEMVSLMAKGGYDLVTASGDASLRLIMGKRVQPINTALIAGWHTLDPRIAQGHGLTSGQSLRHAVSVGTESADVQHPRIPDAAGQLERGLREAGSSGWQNQSGAGAGL